MSRSLYSIIAAVVLMLAAPTLVAAQDAHPPSRAPDSPGCPELDLTEVRAPSVFRYGLTASQLQSDFFADGGLKDQGYRPQRLTGVLDGNTVEFATRWVRAPGPQWRARFGLTDNEFHTEWLANKDTYRITDVSGFNTPAGVRFNIIWERNTTGLGWLVYRNTTADQLQDLIDQHKQDGYAPERVEGYRIGSGDLRFVSTWVKAPRCDWQLHHVLTGDQYQDTFDDYAADGYRQLHLDATSWQSAMRYHGIWWKQPGPVWQVRPNTDWYRFQRFVNNNWCAGFALTNFYTADNGELARYGGIWTFDTPVAIDDASALADQVREEVDCAPGRGGTAVFNLGTGEQILAHADQVFGTSSTIKSAILFALLRKSEADGTSLQTLLDLPVQLGSNQGPDYGGPDGGPLQLGNDETLDFLARMMIDYSNNWATNVLIDHIGMDRINDELADRGLQLTRLNRYMTGTGSPSAHGTSGASGDYADGWDNVTTPREYATFLRLVHENDGLLEQPMYDQFWDIMGLNGDAHDEALDDGVGDWSTEVDQFTKAGSNSWGWDKSTTPWTSTAAPGDYLHRPQLGAHVQRSEAGRLVFDNGQVAVYATFFNDAPDVATYTPFEDALDCITVEVVRAYSGRSSGTDLAQCR